MSSTELIQEEEAADKDSERNPEVGVGGNGEKHAGAVVPARRHFSLGMIAESGVPS